MRLLPVGLFLLAGCGTVSATFDQCELDLVVPDTIVAPGDELVVGGTPHSDRVDTLVTIGDVRAEVVSVERTDCTLCDACRQTECGGLCVACLDCEPSCASCTEALTVRIPDLASGPAEVVVVNRFGISRPLPVNVEVPEDTDTDVDTDSDSDTDTDTDTDTLAN